MNERLRKEYQKLWDNATPEERKALQETGYNPDDPSDDGVPKAHRYFYQEDEEDVREIGSSIKWTSMVHRLIEREPLPQESFTPDEVLEILRKVIALFDDSRKPEVQLHGKFIMMALGVPNLPNMTELSKQYNVTRANISWHIKQIQKKLNLTPSHYMKPDEECAKFSKARKKYLKKKNER